MVAAVQAFLWLLLALDCGQLAFALAAAARGRRSYRAGAPSHARYSYQHAALLAAGSVILAVPIVLGLVGTIGDRAAVFTALVLELAVFPLAWKALGRFDTEHQARRPA
jgi:hypothetical protein